MLLLNTFQDSAAWGLIALTTSVGGVLFSLPNVPFRMRQRASYAAMMTLAAIGWLAAQRGLYLAMVAPLSAPGNAAGLLEAAGTLYLRFPTLVFMGAVPVALAAIAVAPAGWPGYDRSLLCVGFSVLCAAATPSAFAVFSGHEPAWASTVATLALGGALVGATRRRRENPEAFGLLSATFLFFVTISGVADALSAFAEWGFGGGVPPHVLNFSPGDPLTPRVHLGMLLTLQTGSSAGFAALPLLAFGFGDRPSISQDGRWLTVGMVMMGVLTTSPVPFLLLELSRWS